jgi:hypothetical protein
LFEPREDHATYGEGDLRKGDVTLVGWGSVSISQAVKRGDCVLPSPLEKRARLTSETESEHFVFRYRPMSYAERHLEKVIQEREQVYTRLSASLNMELPRRVRIDLYPDMKAKGLGSGTKWTPANTVSDWHIAEVYNERYQCDPYHELTHIFSFHFPGHPALGGQQAAPGRCLVEALAEYFQPGLAASAKRRADKKLKTGDLPPLSEVLAATGPSTEHYALIDFLVQRDVEKFKEFYVRVVGKATAEGVRNAAKEVYGVTLDELESDWHGWLQQGAEPDS